MSIYSRLKSHISYNKTCLNHFIHSSLTTGILNILGLPVTQCPLGVGEEGVPLGVQVVAGKLQDHLTLAVALYLEKMFGGWRDPGAN